MALGRRGARRIVVDGTAYRWRVRRRPTSVQGLCWAPCSFAVECADAVGAVLVVVTDRPRADNWIGRETRPVLPSDVARAVERALREGWAPTAPGSPFLLDLSGGFEASP
ncbi:hypothetical protein ACFYNL_26780 [Streptomyces sp. NPDC007808]|uniref:hypothetical protein n=1 Tax=Streptomyces sp. NPDC007808 TaxID=3364779 RepID=UPI00368B3F47